MAEKRGPACTEAEQLAAFARANDDGANFCNEHIDLVRNFALAEYMETFAEPYEGQSEEEFDAFVLAAAAEFEMGFNHGFELEAQCVDMLEDLVEDRQTIDGTVRDLIGVFHAIARLERTAAGGRGDPEIITLTSVGAGLGESIRNILFPTRSAKVPEEPIPVMPVPSHVEYADA